MIIGIEAERANHPEKTGVEHYAQQLILHLAKIDSTNNYILYLRSEPQDWLLNLPDNFRIKVMPFPKFWTQIRLSWELLLHPVDVLLVPASALPLIHPKKSIVTIHDTAFKYYPEADTAFMRNFLHYSYQYIVKKAWRIIAISGSTKDDLVKFYNVDPGKVAVIHHGYEEQPDIDQKASLSDWISKYNLPAHYLLFLSTLQPRKNLPRLIQAFRIFKNMYPTSPHKLVVVGKAGWNYQESIAAIEANKDIVEYLGHVSNDDKLAIFKGADGFISASLYEGFGMWILESYEAGVPSAVSNVSAMPEIAGNASILFDPTNTESIARAIEQLLMDDKAREELIVLGKERLKAFNWEKCARETLELMDL